MMAYSCIAPSLPRNRPVYTTRYSPLPTYRFRLSTLLNPHESFLHPALGEQRRQKNLLRLERKKKQSQQESFPVFLSFVHESATFASGLPADILKFPERQIPPGSSH